jgi:glutamyl-tRNA reductase
MKWFASLDVVPTIVLIRQKFKRIGEEEIKKTVSSWNGVSVDEVKRISYLVDSIINKILHDPTVYLKRKAKEETGSTGEVVRGLFGIDGEETEDQDRNKG